MAVTPVFDSNILIDYINGYKPAVEELNRHPVRLISIVSWMEVLVGCSAHEQEQKVKDWMAAFFTTLFIDYDIASHAVVIRRNTRLKLPDAVILATARSRNTLLITRNHKDFPPHDPQIRVPYEV